MYAHEKVAMPVVQGSSLQYHRVPSCFNLATEVSIYMVTRSAAPPLPPPPWSMVQDAPPPVGWSAGSLFPLWGGCGGFGVLGLA